jgi:predicted phosphodiesterase
MVTVVHLSDIHCGETPSAKLKPARDAINAIGADCVVVTGDITHHGRRSEFAAARAFIDGLVAPVVGCPGNHDVPVFNPLLRALTPFSRFDALNLMSRWDSRCGKVSIRAFNSARAVQARLDWSQGVYLKEEMKALSASFPERAAYRVLACHHPPHGAPGTTMTVATLGAEAALSHLDGDHVLLCGHLHARSDFPAFGRRNVLVSTAPTLASARMRGQSPGFRVLRFHEARTAEEWVWTGEDYAPAVAQARVDRAAAV